VFLFLLRFFLSCHGFYSPFPFFMDGCNGVLLQLIDCIESMKSDVKRKMRKKFRARHTPKSPRKQAAKIFFLFALRAHASGELCDPGAGNVQQEESQIAASTERGRGEARREQ
jgi:hypothetical protein